MNWFLGVDGGQTATRAVLADRSGSLLARVLAGPSNHTEEPGGPERLHRVTASLLRSLLHTAAPGGACPPNFIAACFGMTGELEIKRRVVTPLVDTPHLIIVHDSANALEGAIAGSTGVIVIAGTGSVARGRNSQGDEWMMGGWGHGFGDEGSAYWIGKEAVRAMLAEFDRMGPKTALSSVIRESTGAKSPHDLIRRYYAGSFSRDDLAGLAQSVDEAAEAGDQVAQSILNCAGQELGKLACALIRRLFPNSVEGENGPTIQPPVCYTGGAFRSRTVLSTFCKRVQDEFPRFAIEPPRLPPVLGSLLLAYRAAGISISELPVESWRGTLNALPEQHG